MNLEPSIIVSLGIAIGIIILSLGGAIRLARSRVRETPPTRVSMPSGEGDMHSALMRRLHSDLNRTYGPRRPTQ